MGIYIAELIGTFALVFCGTGAIIFNAVSGGVVTHVGISATFGLIVLAMIYAIGDISGAHINPAVTFGFWLSGRLPGRQVAPYIVSQCLGAILASFVLGLTFPYAMTLGKTVPTAPMVTAFFIEVILAFFLMFVIIHVAAGAKEKGIMVALRLVLSLDWRLCSPDPSQALP